MTETDLEFRTLPGLWREYAEKERLFAFKAGDLESAREWQQHLRTELTSLLGDFPTPACDLSPRLLEVYTEAVFGAAHRLDIDVFKGEHAWSGARAYNWLAQSL